ncbi:MAG: hypothetical protein AAGI23_22585 [Bacteroidota bacterium]
MKTLMIGLSVLALLLFSCRENVDLTEVDISIPDAQELNDFQLLGNVTDLNEEGILSAKIELIQDGIVLGSTTTDRNGRYILEAPVKADQSLFVRSVKEGFVTATDAVLAQENSITHTTVLMPDEMLGQGQRSMSQAEFIILFGTLIDRDSVPQARKYVLVEDPDGNISYALTTREGKFRVAAPAETALKLTVFNSICRQEEYSERIGSFSEDQELGEIVINSNQNESVAISGQLVDCNDEPIANGTIVVISVNEIQQTISDASGNFRVAITSCSGNQGISIIGYSENFENASETITVTPTSGSVALDPIEVCTSGASTIELTVDGTAYRNKAAHTFLLNSRGPSGLNLLYPQNRRSGLTIYFPGNTTGTYEVNTFVYTDDQIVVTGGSRVSNRTAISVTITTYEEDIIEGSFTGQVLNEETQTLVPMEGTFSVSK